MIRDFVFDMAKTDDRVVVIKPSIPIKQMLEKEGYPFKSKVHSCFVARYQKRGMMEAEKGYLGLKPESWHSRTCPNILKYQFTDKCNLKISDHCCVEMKEKPLQKWAKENNKIYSITGIMREEGGRRTQSQCLAFSGKKLTLFQPLVVVSKEWEDWFIDAYNVEICDIYKPPYNFERTGCKGCPFALHLQDELDTLEKYFPNERKQCEMIWKPVYDEYRRIGYRLKKDYDMEE
jgi:3'-phosphoadenosine 5'-phosphosulfate sulfotransferase (PAPS reductase)/FAD synthetase